jgi:hypothetical protein
VTVAPLLERFGSITTLIDSETEDAALACLRAAEVTGRPLGSDNFVTRFEDLLQRRPRRQKPWTRPRLHATFSPDWTAGLRNWVICKVSP